MKKKTLLNIAVAGLILLSGCGGQEAGSSKEDGVLAAIKSKGEIQIAIEGAYPPYNYINSNNELEGFDVDFSQELSKRLGVKATLVSNPWDSMIPALIGKKFDIIVSDMAITEERKKKVDFSNPYFTTGNQLFIPNDSPIQDPAEIKGKKIGVTISTTAADMATELGAEVVLYKNDFLAFDDLLSGRLEGMITDQGVGAKIIKDKNYPLKSIGDLLNKETAGITIRKEDTDLRDEINKAISDMQSDGTYEQISKKWFGKDIR